MRLIYNPSGTSHARDALRIENRAEQRRHFKTTRRDVVGWILAAEENISLATRRNAWRKTGFAYFSD